MLWDFDGTLGQRRTGRWGACLLQLLDRELPAHEITREVLSPHLQRMFPWHDHHLEHPHLSEPARWWQHINGLLAGALAGAGLPSADADRVVTTGFRQLYLHPDEWELYPDAIPALAAVNEAGARNVIVSNHVPELPDLIDHLGLADLVDVVITSAIVGAEKPHPAIFRAALAAVDFPDRVWIVGDNPVADIAGAARLGIPGVLVRAPDFTPDYVDRINRSYAGTDWLDWAEHCQVRAESLVDSADLILTKLAGPASAARSGRCAR